MKTLQVSQFKARCLGLLKEIRDTGEPLVLTLRGETIAIVRPSGDDDPQRRESVAETISRHRPPLLAEDEDFEITVRSAARSSAVNQFPDEE